MIEIKLNNGSVITVMESEGKVIRGKGAYNRPKEGVYGDCLAAENLDNYSICVRQGRMIRKLNFVDDIYNNSLVFVCNLEKIPYSNNKIIKAGDMVRYKKVNVEVMS